MWSSTCKYLDSYSLRLTFDSSVSFFLMVGSIYINTLASPENLCIPEWLSYMAARLPPQSPQTRLPKITFNNEHTRRSTWITGTAPPCRLVLEDL